MAWNQKPHMAMAIASFVGFIVSTVYSILFGLTDSSSLAFVGLTLLTVYLFAITLIWCNYSKLNYIVLECVTLAIVLALILSIYDGVDALRRSRDTQTRQASWKKVQIILSSVTLLVTADVRITVWRDLSSSDDAIKGTESDTQKALPV